jgi:hypothetical protein
MPAKTATAPAALTNDRLAELQDQLDDLLLRIDPDPDPDQPAPLPRPGSGSALDRLQDDEPEDPDDPATDDEPATSSPSPKATTTEDSAASAQPKSDADAIEDLDAQLDAAVDAAGRLEAALPADDQAGPEPPPSPAPDVADPSAPPTTQADHADEQDDQTPGDYVDVGDALADNLQEMLDQDRQSGTAATTSDDAESEKPAPASTADSDADPVHATAAHNIEDLDQQLAHQAADSAESELWEDDDGISGTFDTVEAADAAEDSSPAVAPAHAQDPDATDAPLDPAATPRHLGVTAPGTDLDIHGVFQTPDQVLGLDDSEPQQAPFPKPRHASHHHPDSAAPAQSDAPIKRRLTDWLHHAKPLARRTAATALLLGEYVVTGLQSACRLINQPLHRLPPAWQTWVGLAGIAQVVLGLSLLLKALL